MISQKKTCGVMPINAQVEITKWSSIKQIVYNRDPDLAHAIDKHPISKNLRLVVAEYPFGCPIVHNGQFFLYHNNELSTLSAHKLLPKPVQSLLNYPWESMPTAILLQNGIESTIDLPTHTIPLRTFEPGAIFPLHALFKRYPTVIQGAYQYYAGARSLFMLSKLAHQQYNQRLAKIYKFPTSFCPKTYEAQWELFCALAHSKQFPQTWSTKVAFLTAPFFEELQTQSNHSQNLKYQLLNQVWQRTFISQYQGMYELAWSLFLEGLDKSKFPDSQSNVLETAKLLIKIAMRVSPGFIPTQDETFGPITQFSKAIMEDYRLRYYLPIFMQPGFFNGIQPVYYSLHRPIYPHAISQRRPLKRSIVELIQLKKIINQFQAMVVEERFPFPTSGSLLLQTLRNIEFDFYHPNGSGELNTNIQEIYEDDERFMTLINGMPCNENLTFPDSALFFHGCIRIRSKEEAARKQPSMRDFLMPLRKKTFSP